MATATRNQRLDHPPFNTAHRKLVIGPGIGWALDAMDVGLISFTIAALAKEWSLTPGQSGLIASIGMADMTVDATLGSLIADKFGRKQVFALSLLVFDLVTGVSASCASLGVLLVFHFIAGLGLGPELSAASTLVSEFAPVAVRRRIIVLLEAFWALGWLLAALIGHFIVPAAGGWCWALGLGVILTLYAIYVRRSIPESVRFLQRKGREDEAKAAVAQFEAGTPLWGSTPAASDVDSGSAAPSVRAQAKRETAAANRGVVVPPHPVFLARTIGLWGVWFFLSFTYYDAFIWLPGLLAKSGIDLPKSFGYTLIITLAQIPRYLVVAWLIEKWGRRVTLVAFLAGAGVGVFWFSMVLSPAGIIAAGCVLSFFALGAWDAVYAVTPEVYPTGIRATGSGWAASFGRLASIAAPLLAPVLLQYMLTVGIFTVSADAFALAMASGLLLRETKASALVRPSNHVQVEARTTHIRSRASVELGLG